MKVSIDRDLCTGDAQCADICPEVFFVPDDGEMCLCSVRPEVDVVPATLEDAVVEAAEYCPGSCIFVEA